jgi:hypothetical protein
MQRFRSIRRFGAALGLAALLIQLAVSFGHLHPEDLLPPRLIVGEIAGKAAPPGQEQERHPPGAPHDDCPICAVMYLAGIIVQPVPPSLTLPVQFTTVAFAAAVDLSCLPIRRHPPFQTRAPPVA